MCGLVRLFQKNIYTFVVIYKRIVKPACFGVLPSLPFTAKPKGQKCAASPDRTGLFHWNRFPITPAGRGYKLQLASLSKNTTVLLASMISLRMQE